MRKSKKKTWRIIGVSLIIIVGALWAFSVFIYNENINQRLESYQPIMFKLEDFDGLVCTKYKFPSDKGQMLAGALYSAGDDQKGIIILSHGFGSGYNSYLDAINYLAHNGYYVFAYDGTGNDESEGQGVGGFPQGAVDLEYAISFVKESGNFPDLPIGLFGHSWGAYSVCSVLAYYPEIKAVIACSGANKSSDYFEAAGKKQAGDFIYAMMPFIKIHERIKFGKYASHSAMDGFEASDAAVLIAHSEDDNIIPREYGYDLFYEKYKDDPRFTFLLFKDKGHSDFFMDSKNTYKAELVQALEKWAGSLAYDYKADENKDQFAKDKAEYIEAMLNREKWANRLDEDLFEQFIDFYNSFMTSN